MSVKYAPRTQAAAMATALTFDGHHYKEGWCQAFVVVNVFGTGAVGDYDGDRAADAEDGWKKAKDHGRVVLAKDIKDMSAIPGGLMMYWGGGSHDNGHAATSLPKGKLFTTDKTPGVCGIVANTWPHTHWGLTFLGYVLEEGNGFTLTDRPNGKPPVASWSTPSSFVLGATGPDVTRLGERLVIWAAYLRLSAPYSQGPGPTFTETDRAAVKAFQGAQGWRGADADGYPGAETLKRLAADPPKTPPVGRRLTTSVSLNRADYDTVGKTPKVYGGGTGRATRAKRTPAVAKEVLKGRPDWIHLQECDADQVAPMDDHLERYTRVGAGGKGRESWHNQDSKITVLAASLLNVTPELEGDDKPFLLIVQEVAGHRGIEVNFHNENEGTKVQKGQLDNIMSRALAYAKKWDVDPGSVHLTGDTNYTGAVAHITAAGWLEGESADKVKNTSFKSTNGWAVTKTKGGRIDVDAVGRGGEIASQTNDLLPVPVGDHNPHRSSYYLV